MPVVDYCLAGTIALQGLQRNFMCASGTTRKIASYEKIPKIILDLFIYTRNLNHVDDINFGYWKAMLKTKIPKNYFCQPYEWVARAKAKSKV